MKLNVTLFSVFENNDTAKKCEPLPLFLKYNSNRNKKES